MPKFTENADRPGQVASCEMIQEIYGLGAYYLLREDEEIVFERLMLKYHRVDYRVSETDSRPREGEQFVELLIRKALSQRKSELITTRREHSRKESVLGAAAGLSSGTANKGAGDSKTVLHSSGLGRGKSH